VVRLPGRALHGSLRGLRSAAHECRVDAARGGASQHRATRLFQPAKSLGLEARGFARLLGHPRRGLFPDAVATGTPPARTGPALPDGIRRTMRDVDMMQ